MTCLQYKPLLDDYADNELSTMQAEKIEQHLKNCSACRLEFEETRRLKELLKIRPTTIPDKQYWDENESLIFARTIESDAWSKANQTSESVRSDFFRSLLSAAAALVLLAVSIFLGTAQNKAFTENNPIESPIFVLSPLDETNDTDNSFILTKAEQINQIKGMMLIGPPGMLSRFPVMYEYNNQSY